MGQQNGVYPPQTILGKPFHCGSLEVLANIDDNRPVAQYASQSVDVLRKDDLATHHFRPSLPSMRARAEVFLLMFFFPSGLSVDRQVRHGLRSGGAVKQSRWGSEDDVPVPRKMNSMSAVGLVDVLCVPFMIQAGG